MQQYPSINTVWYSEAIFWEIPYRNAATALATMSVYANIHCSMYLDYTRSQAKLLGLIDLLFESLWLVRIVYTFSTNLNTFWATQSTIYLTINSIMSTRSALAFGQGKSQPDLVFFLSMLQGNEMFTITSKRIFSRWPMSSSFNFIIKYPFGDTKIVKQK